MDLKSIIQIVLTSSIVSTVIVLILDHFLIKSRLKSEHERLVEREIFFNLQKQAEKVFIVLDKIRWNFERISKFAKNGDLREFETAIKNNQEELIEQISPAQIYFSTGVIKKYDGVVKIHREYSTLVGEIRKNKSVTGEPEDGLTKLKLIFNDAVQNCKSAVLMEIEEQKKHAKE